MFNKKLKIFKNYFDENLTFKKIKYFIINVNLFILFIIKNNDNLKLYVDYKNLNIVFFKNKYVRKSRERFKFFERVLR